MPDRQFGTQLRKLDTIFTSSFGRASVASLESAIWGTRLIPDRAEAPKL